MSQNCRQKGRNANKHSHIGRHGIGQSNIFQQKIEINAAKACRRKNNFLLEIDVFCSVGIEQKCDNDTFFLNLFLLRFFITQ